MPSVLILKEKICSKICSKSRLKCAKSPFPVHVRRSKTSLLKLPIDDHFYIVFVGCLLTPSPASIQGTHLFKGHFRRSRQCPLNRGSTVLENYKVIFGRWAKGENYILHPFKSPFFRSSRVLRKGEEVGGQLGKSSNLLCNGCGPQMAVRAGYFSLIVSLVILENENEDKLIDPNPLLGRKT